MAALVALHRASERTPVGLWSAATIPSGRAGKRTVRIRANAFNAVGATLCNFRRDLSAASARQASPGGAASPPPPNRCARRAPSERRRDCGRSGMMRPCTRYWGSKLPGPCRFPAGIEPFQAFAAPFPREPVWRQALPSRDPGHRNADDRLFAPGPRQARRRPRPDRSAASGGKGNGFDGTGHSVFSLRTAAREHIKNDRHLVKILSVFGGGRCDRAYAAIPCRKLCGGRGRLSVRS